MLLTGSMIGATEAYMLSMINHVCESHEIDEKIQSILDEILNKSPEVIALGK